MGKGEGGIIWENGIEICIISYTKRIASSGSMHDTGCLGLVAKDTVPFYKKYEDMDARVRTGAYHIVGTDRVVKAKQGQTLGRISRSILGEGMECYMEVYNNMKASTVLEEGQEVLIPKLEWKKKKKN